MFYISDNFVVVDAEGCYKVWNINLCSMEGAGRAKDQRHDNLLETSSWARSQDGYKAVRGASSSDRSISWQNNLVQYFSYENF